MREDRARTVHLQKYVTIVTDELRDNKVGRGWPDDHTSG